METIDMVVYALHAIAVFVSLVALIGLFWNLNRLRWHYRTARRLVTRCIAACCVTLALWIAFISWYDGHIGHLNWAGHLVGVALLGTFIACVGKALHEY